MTGDEIRAAREKCADCGGQLQEIRVRQNGPYNVLMPLTYLSNEPKKHKWLGEIQATEGEGTLLAFACSSCARVAFYAAAKDEKTQ